MSAHENRLPVMFDTFLRFNDYYLRLGKKPADRPAAHLAEGLLQLVDKDRPFSGNTLPKGLMDMDMVGQELIALEDGPLLIIGDVADYGRQTLLGGTKIHSDKLKHDGWTRFADWKSYWEEKLLKLLLESVFTLEEPVSICAQYSQHDAFSLWILNPHTNTFTCAASSHQYPRTFISESDSSSLFSFLKSDKVYESRSPTPELCPNSALKEFKTLNRIRVDLGHSGTQAILHLYSRHPHFEVPEKLIPRITDIIRSKYGESRIELHKRYEHIEHFFSTQYAPGQLQSFLERLTEEVCLRLSFEACSIFLVKQANRLDLVSSCDAAIHGAPPEGIYYPIDANSLTGLVAETLKVQVSYDLPSDPRNSKHYSEQTKLPAMNWIGVPVVIAERLGGVIRVKNKLSLKTDVREIRNIRPADIEYLTSIATMLASIIRIEQLHEESQSELSAAHDKLAALNDFNRVFLHEIKTPISIFALAPLIMRRSVTQLRQLAFSSADGGNVSVILDAIEKKLSDVVVMAERLKFIADVYFFDLIIKKNDPRILSLLGDVVFPIVTVTREHLRRKYGLDLRLDTQTLSGIKVMADQTMITLVLNALIDNAGKYTIENRRPITISGSTDARSREVSVIVSNYGLPVDDDERDSIFEKGERGRHPNAMGVEGTGIGLHLARQIMRNQGGDVRLVRTRDPVQFAIVFRNLS